MKYGNKNKLNIPSSKGAESKQGTENIEWSYSNRLKQVLMTGETNSSNHDDSMAPTYGQEKQKEKINTQGDQTPITNEGVAVPQLQLDKLNEALNQMNNSTTNKALKIVDPNTNTTAPCLLYDDEKKQKKVRAKTAGQRSRKTVQSQTFVNASDPN